MSSDARTCHDENIVYVHENQTIHICLVEDRNYRLEFIKRQIRDKIQSCNEDVLNSIIDEIREFFKELRDDLRQLIRLSYRKSYLLDISLPDAGEEHIYTGEILGDIALKTDHGEIMIHIAPKIGWENFKKMFNEALVTIDGLVNQGGVSHPMIGELIYPLFNSIIAYSISLLELTPYVLKSPPPPAVTEKMVVSEGQIGKPVTYPTIKYLSMGLPVGIFEKKSLIHNVFPLILLARFHSMLITDLSEVIKNLENATKSFFQSTLISRIKDLMRSHQTVLDSEVVRTAFRESQFRDISDRELVIKTKSSSHLNPFIQDLVDLYLTYLRGHNLARRLVDKGWILPTATSKIYELWVLSWILKVAESLYGTTPTVIGTSDGSLEIQVGKLLIEYNKPHKGELFASLIGQPLYPDFLLKVEDKAVVCDAKYKNIITTDDLHRLLSYVIEFAKPISSNRCNQRGDKCLVGCFLKLSGADENKSAIKIIDSKFNIKIMIIELDPSKNPSIIEESLRNIMEHLELSH